MTRRTDRRPTEHDRAMVARREAGATRKAIAEEFGVPVSQVSGAEWLIRREKRGQELLAVDPESLEGFHLIGDLEWRAWDTAYSLTIISVKTSSWNALATLPAPVANTLRSDARSARWQCLMHSLRRSVL